MNYRELGVILPCHSLEDFPLYHTGEDAASLLACWTAIWHPALIAGTQSTPKWHRADLTPEDLAGRLLLIPSISVAQLPPGFLQQVQDAGGWAIRGDGNRESLILQLLAGAGVDLPQFDAEYVADFLALGYAYLQVQVLTRQMRYASNLDDTHFFNQVLASVRAAASGDRHESQSKLQACFDLLAEERDHYYSVDAYLIDLTLLADTVLGRPLAAELGCGLPINLLLHGELAQLIRQRDPASHEAISAGLAEGRVGLVAGDATERRLPLLSCEGILAELRRGVGQIQDVWGQPVQVYGRRRFGLTPFLPAVLEKLQFRGALHATLDDGHFPAASQIKTRWQGLDGSVIDAIAKPPLDASQPETFLSLAQKLGESMDTDHVATLCFAHWPGAAAPWYSDLRRCARYTSALGKFVTVERYFADTYLPGHLDRNDADPYRSPYLRQDVIRKRPDPISQVMRYWSRRIVADAAATAAALAHIVRPNSSLSAGTAPEGTDVAPLAADWSTEIVESAAGDDRADRCDLELDAAWEQHGQALAAAVLGLAGGTNSVGASRTSVAQPGYFLVNPHSGSSRVCVDISRLDSLPAAAKPVYHTGAVKERKLAVVDVPPLGYVWLTAGKGHEMTSSQEPPLVEDQRSRGGPVWLRNEYFEATVNSVTGALQTFKDYRSRGNRLSQQLALRLPPGRPRETDSWPVGGEPLEYSVMAADEVTVEVSSTVLGEVRVRGRLLDRQGHTLAAYQQLWRVVRGSRVLQAEIELQPQVEPGSNAWASYYACRFAWSDETADLYASVQQTRQRVTKRRIEAPLFVDIESGERRTTILTGGLPYHQRVQDRMLDSLLIVRGEQQRKFRLGIGLDLSQPLAESLQLVCPPRALFLTSPPPSPAQAWLFHIDARSVVATHWSPVSDSGPVTGVRVRLLETSGRNLRARLSAFRPFESARQVNFVGETLRDLTVEDGRVVLDLAGNEWTEVEARWGTKP